MYMNVCVSVYVCRCVYVSVVVRGVSGCRGKRMHDRGGLCVYAYVGVRVCVRVCVCVRRCVRVCGLLDYWVVRLVYCSVSGLCV